MGNNPSRRRPGSASGAAGQPPEGAAASGYPGATAPPPTGPHYVHPNMLGGQRAMPQAGMFPFVDGSRPPELRGQNLYPWRPMPRQNMPQMQKTYTIKNDVNLKKNTLKLVPEPGSTTRFSLQFDFDASTDCRITVYFVATEVEGQLATYKAVKEDDPEPMSKMFPKGLGQQFRTEPMQVLDVAKYSEELLKYTTQNPRRYPIIIRLESVAAPDASSSLEAAKPAVQSQSTFATLVLAEEWTPRVLKQTIQVGDRSFELQEIYGIDQAASGVGAETAKADDLDEENGRECVICMTEPRDTTVLPCRHMCMCNKCAKVLRVQSNKCPICRTNVDSLLQIKVKGSDKTEVPPTPKGDGTVDQLDAAAPADVGASASG